MRRVFSLFVFCGLAVSGASAFDVGNCSYEVISEAEKSCRLTHVSADTGWSLTVPASVSYGSASYTVTEIGENAMADCKGTLTSLSLASSPVPRILPIMRFPEPGWTISLWDATSRRPSMTSLSRG